MIKSLLKFLPQIRRTYCHTEKNRAVLTLYTKENCQLCDIAKEKLRHLEDRVNSI